MNRRKSFSIKNALFTLAPFLFGVLLLILLVFVDIKYKLSYSNIKGFENVLESMVNFLSIVIGFYSAFYGMIISMTKTDFLIELSKSKYKNVLPKTLVFSLLSSFSALIITVFMQVLFNYPSNFAFFVYLLWGFLVGVFITYSIQTALLSISMIFYSDSESIPVEDV